MPRVLLYHGDMRDVLANLPADSIDSVVTDPPYELGFMGKSWDRTGIAFNREAWAAVLRVLKPGGHLLAFGGSRTVHRIAVAIEDAGFEIRDQIMWLYGSGFPKSLDVSKAIDKAAGAEREVVGKKFVTNAAQGKGLGHGELVGGKVRAGLIDITAPATDAAKQWQGWGTALKPAHEPIVVARKPLVGTVAANVLTHGTGALNIDRCRVGVEGGTTKGSKPVGLGNGIYGAGLHGACEIRQLDAGRWPANVIHDGSDEVLSTFPKASPSTRTRLTGKRSGKRAGVFSEFAGQDLAVRNYIDSGGSAARFFYCAKASKADRAGSKHPTVKPVALMAWLTRLVTPPGGTVLDPFAGTGTTGVACVREGFNAIMCELSGEYVTDIQRRFTALAAPLALRLIVKAED